MALINSGRLISFIFIFFSITIPYASPLFFNLSNIKPYNTNNTINVTGDASISNQGIELTPPDRSVASGAKTGRATYIQPLHLWDKDSGNLTDFTTHFSFVIDSLGSFRYSDGLAFFMAPVGSTIPPSIPTIEGGSLGLLSGNGNDFVAVEFDTFQDIWDPPVPHVGINLKSMESVINVTWFNNITLGKENEAWITYNSTSKSLDVVFTGFLDDRPQKGSLHYPLNLMYYLPEWVTFGFSAATGDWFEKNTVKTWEFYSSFGGDYIDVRTPESNIVPSSVSSSEPNIVVPSPVRRPEPNIVTTGKKRHGMGIGLIVGLSVASSIVIVGGLALGCYALWKKRTDIREEIELVFDASMEHKFKMGSGPKKFSYGELVRATNNFAEEEKLGEGGFGGVYRGFLRELDSNVAIKRISRESKQGTKEYASEVTIISQLRHRNLVQLVGWCHEKARELLLVYEYMPNGSLDSHLFKDESLLGWAVRYKIAKGLASALLYLHEEWEQCVMHRDIKSSNVMLDSNFNAKLGDFGLARLVDHEKELQTTVLAGTMAYMAPECVITGKATKESDVYSFGVVALEIACGRKPINLMAPEGQKRLVEWIWNLYGISKILEAADPKLDADFDEQEMGHLMIVGLWCAHPDPKSRPSIRQAIHVLNFEASLPILPSKMPVPTYSTPPIYEPNPSQPLSYCTAASESSQIQSLSYSYNSDSSKFASSEASSSSVALLHTW